MYREWKKVDFPKEYCIWIWKQQDQEADQETDGWMNWGRMEKWSVESSGRKKCMTGRNGRGSWERQGITAFCTCQWIDWLTWNVTLQVHPWNTRHNSCISAPKFLIHVHLKLLKSMMKSITSDLSSFRNTSIFISKLAKTNLNSLFHTDIKSRNLHHLLSSLWE